ncbi:hypothetical protein MU1_35100 [Paenibacillus glycanilyticus]|uniref:Uncharacterized protein n=2 Tax=Paenibacillus glycanilyticus TaxID=126569 RepID=A0ABQ6GFB2_9BACL|nr:hypothetical protein MU1_35100 [Paenibacillus glycanilyticus]
MGTGEGSRTAALEKSLQAVPSRPSEPPRARLAAAKAQPQPQAVAADHTVKTDIKAEELRKAVVWAEILGPPRAKRPFGK